MSPSCKLQVSILLAVLLLTGETCVIAQQSGFPGKQWPTATPSDVGLDAEPLRAARDYALTGGGSGYITRHGKLVMTWGDLDRRYDLKSTTKSIGVTALGLAIADHKMSLSDKAVKHQPGFAVPPKSNRATGWIERISIRHLATQTAGFEKPGGYTKLIYKPGTKWAYSDGGPNWLAECITLAYQRDLQDLMFQRVFTPLGIQRDDLVWRKNAYRDARIDGVMRREFGSGISANVDALARIGYLYLRNGQWKGKQIIPRAFVAMVGTTVASVKGLPEVDPDNYGNASDHYGLLWWNNADGTLPHVPRDAYWSWGLYDSLIVVIPSLDMVIARAGKSWDRKWSGHYDVLQPFLDPIVAAARLSGSVSSDRAAATSADSSPYPRSRVIFGIHWAPADTIVRRAPGGDNWPITWADDDQLYTAYGDGRGFKPLVPRKLSMGLVRVTGSPNDFQGVNLRSESFERTGDGRKGPKASSLLMVNRVLYGLVRNARNSQLVWSKDHGRNWTWSAWTFETSFGYPVFLNYGRNYAGARDHFVYIYSHDSDSAYDRADRMVLARVSAEEITAKGAYEYFVRLDEKGAPEWTSDVSRRGAVFKHAGHCYRSSVSYNAPLRRYLWCQTGLGEETRRAGGFAIYDAAEPWGPWTTVFFTPQWDVGPGETSCLPTKWMSADGRTIHLVFSGDDSFSVRRAVLQ